MLLPENDAKLTRTWEDFYLPCPEHPNADMKRTITPSRDSKGVGYASHEAVCTSCGRILSKKPKR